jgi:hypothetical protein
MQLIGAGLPRTGTLTQKVALEQLGVGPCYHWVDLLADLSQVDVWNRAMDGEIGWFDLLQGFRSTADWPGGYFYRELMERYPDAKVLLSVRGAESWERSFRDTIWMMCKGQELMPLLSRARASIDPSWHDYLTFVDRMFWGPQGTFRDPDTSPQKLMEQMHLHNETVKSVVPSDRLLVWEVSEGWGPLCEFLDVQAPDEPFPHVNDSGTFIERVIGGALGALDAWREQNLTPTP